MTDTNELEIKLSQQQILVQPGRVMFASFPELKQEALELAEHIKAVEVNPENIKVSKKLLAEVNKRVNQLEDNRKQVKKTLLEEYQLFEEQVKEIVSIVKEADDVVRQQVKQMEEAERDEKKSILENLFNKRMVHYTFRDLFNFQDFLKPRHLNKTVSIEAVEKEMVGFLEMLAKDFNAIGKMQDAEAILIHYVEVKDLAEAITLHETQKAKKQAVVDSKAIKQPAGEKIAFLVSVRCHNEKELKFVKYLLKENHFDFTIDNIY